MDLSKHNPQVASDTANRLEITDPFSGEPLKDEDGTPMAMHVLGMQSTVARNIDAKHRREVPQADKKRDDMTESERTEYDERIAEYAKNAGAEKLAAMVTKLEGKWEANGKPVKHTDKDTLTDLFASQDWLANQAIQFSRNLANYRPKM